MAGTKYLKGECQQCGGHLEFPAEQTGLVADCPHCGQGTELLLARPPDASTVPRTRIVWAIIAVVILGAGLAASLVALRMAERRAQRLHPAGPTVPKSSKPIAPPSVASDSLAQQGFAASAVDLEKSPGTSLVYATGTLTNLSKQQRFGVKVEFDLVNSTGDKVGTATDYQAVMDAGSEWRFRALVVDDKAVGARLASVKEEK